MLKARRHRPELEWEDAAAPFRQTDQPLITLTAGVCPMKKTPAFSQLDETYSLQRHATSVYSHNSCREAKITKIYDLPIAWLATAKSKHV